MGVKYDHNAVVIEEAPKLNYTHNYVCLPYDYGRESYENRADALGADSVLLKRRIKLPAASARVNQHAFARRAYIIAVALAPRKERNDLSHSISPLHIHFIIS